MISFRMSTSLPVLGLLLAMAGCSGQQGSSSTGAADPQAAEQTQAVNTNATPHAFRGHGGGPDFLLHAALHEDIGLSADQKTAIENAMTAARPAAPPVVDRAPFMALAASVRAGKVDVASFAKATTTVNDGASTRQANAAKAVSTLHSILTTTQRQALVDAITKHETQHRDHRPTPADAKQAKGPRGDHHGRFGMLKGLDLTSAQRDAIHAAFQANKPADVDHTAMKAQFEAMRTQHAARLQSFIGESFDAAAFVARPAGAPKMGSTNHMDRMAKELAIITPILTASQRETLATRIEQGPPQRHDKAPEIAK